MKISNKLSDDLLSEMILIVTLVLTKGTSRKTRFIQPRIVYAWH